MRAPHAACEAGMGIATLARITVDGTPRLTAPEDHFDIWARRPFRDEMADALMSMKGALRGVSP